jgi:thiol-disulfide isomerase/thioredoxin
MRACAVGLALGVGFLAVSVHSPLAHSEPVAADSGFIPVQVHFTRQVENIELDSNELISTQPRNVRVAPRDARGALWFARILRRLPGTPIARTGYARRQDAVFAASYVGSSPAELWCDTNLNGDLSDDPPLRLYAYPDPPGSRAGLVDLHWVGSRGKEQVPIDWKVRIVLEPLVETPPRFRVQLVHAMTGTLAVDGRPRRAFLYDGNRDGMYTTDMGDGVFVDADGDGKVLVDPSADEFIPFGVTAQVGGTSYRTSHVALNGADVSMALRSGEPPLKKLALGEEAPDFEFASIDGRQIRLSAYRGRPVVVYFWASWCGTCTEMAPGLHALYDRFHPQGLEILAISFDRERQPMLDFAAEYRETWPISYTGRGFWENAVGRRYGVSVAGVAYLIDQNGAFAGVYGDLDKLALDLPSLFLVGAARPTQGTPNGSKMRQEH